MTLTTQVGENGGSGTEILKVDRMGRVRVPRERRRALLVEFERSGMSAVEFAKWSGVKYQTFATWVQKKRGRAEGCGRDRPEEAVAMEPMKWAEAVCAQGEAAPGPAVVIRFGGEVQVEARDGRVAAELLAALGVGRC
jgi:transposase